MDIISQKKATIEVLKDIHDALIKANCGTTSILDIPQEFNWTAYKSRNKQSNPSAIQMSVPYCYAVEKQQLYSSMFMNFLNSIESGVTGVSMISDHITPSTYTEIASALSGLKSSISSMYQSVSSAVGGSVSSAVGAASYATDNQAGEFVETAAEREARLQRRGNEVISNATNSVKNFVNTYGPIGSSYTREFFEKLKDAFQNLDNKTLSGVLSPYRYLYATKDTGKQYVFPMLSSEDLLFNIKNNWGETGGSVRADKGNFDLADILNGVPPFSTVGKLADLAGSYGAGIASVVSQYNSFMNNADAAPFFNVNKETAKSYNFPTDGPSLNVNFVLYNTVEKNMWRKHLRFIYLFGMRNAPFRTSNMTYIVPPLYDVIVPAGRRLPLCYVSSYSVTPIGSTRMLKLPAAENFINTAFAANNALVDITSSNDLAVMVPEAWQVNITFQSLLAPTANLYLAELTDSSKIQTRIDTTIIPSTNDIMAERDAYERQNDYNFNNMA